MRLNKRMIREGNYLFKYRGQVPLILLLIGAFIILQTSNYEQFNEPNLHATRFLKAFNQKEQIKLTIPATPRPKQAQMIHFP